MKLTSFFVVSAALHAALFVSPVPFPDRKREQITPVMIVSPINEGEKSAHNDVTARKEFHAAILRNVAMAVRPIRQAVSEAAKTIEPENQAGSSEISAAVGEGITLARSSNANADGQTAPLSVGSISNGDRIAGWQSSRAGSGSGGGRSSVDAGVLFTQARYSDTPRPHYPERARREGREGRVLLRVLVDEEGRSKSVQVNLSSGSEALDQAAAEAIKRWRFSPARQGDQPIESWVRIPVDFRLTDARD